jgi:programmed cell death 6-interacting protein
MFRHDLDVIDALRRDAVNSRDAHPTGIKKLHTYAGQLVWMSGKFPIDVWTPSSSTLFLFSLLTTAGQ